MAAVNPPVEVVLAQDVRTVPGPAPGWAYEAKFDGWRAVLFARAGLVQSRTGKDLTSRFPEIAAAGRSLPDVVLDGELVALTTGGTLDFLALQTAPAARSAAGVEVYFVAFDLLATARLDLRPRPYRERRRRLERLLADVSPPLQLVPMTSDRVDALKWLRADYGHVGIEGVVSKRLDAPYLAGRHRQAWVKTRQKIVTDAVVLGVTGALAYPHALVLGHPGPGGELHAVGLSLPLSQPQRTAIAELLHPASSREKLPGVIAGLPGRAAFEYQPVVPSVVVEVEADPLIEFGRFRHRPRVRRIRTDLAQ